MKSDYIRKNTVLKALKASLRTAVTLMEVDPKSMSYKKGEWTMRVLKDLVSDIGIEEEFQILLNELEEGSWS